MPRTAANELTGRLGTSACGIIQRTDGGQGTGPAAVGVTSRFPRTGQTSSACCAFRPGGAVCWLPCAAVIGIIPGRADTAIACAPAMGQR
jgi:hypothetical protein